jgi:subtilisin family serine protease
VIAAIDNNREGIAGIAPAASIVGLKACWEQEGDASAAAVCNTFTLAKALVAALDANSDVVNLSLGGPPDPLLQRLVDHGARRGVIYVGALSSERGFPCNLATVICVGSAGRWSDGPQLFAPGQEVLTLTPGGRYDFLSGSSLAAASVSASVALLRARQPDLTAEMALRLLAPTAQPVANHVAPSIDVCDALAQLLQKAKCQ